jgi:hypothetical protein
MRTWSGPWGSLSKCRVSLEDAAILTPTSLSIQRPDLPQCSSKGQRHRRGIVQSCVDALESGSGVPQPRPPYWGSGAPFLGVLNQVGDYRSVRQRLFQQASAF